jgi:hypothetical protein
VDNQQEAVEAVIQLWGKKIINLEMSQSADSLA